MGDALHSLRSQTRNSTPSGGTEGDDEQDDEEEAGGEAEEEEKDDDGDGHDQDEQSEQDEQGEGEEEKDVDGDANMKDGFKGSTRTGHEKAPAHRQQEQPPTTEAKRGTKRGTKRARSGSRSGKGATRKAKSAKKTAGASAGEAEDQQQVKKRNSKSTARATSTSQGRSTSSGNELGDGKDEQTAGSGTDESEDRDGNRLLEALLTRFGDDLLKGMREITAAFCQQHLKSFSSQDFTVPQDAEPAKSPDQRSLPFLIFNHGKAADAMAPELKGLDWQALLNQLHIAGSARCDFWQWPGKSSKSTLQQLESQDLDLAAMIDTLQQPLPKDTFAPGAFWANVRLNMHFKHQKIRLSLCNLMKLLEGQVVHRDLKPMPDRDQDEAIKQVEEMATGHMTDGTGMPTRPP